jgi:hypothetical protein
MSCGFGATVSDTSSHSFGCRGKLSEDDLQAFTAQVRKLRVRSFIFVVVCCGEEIVVGSEKEEVWRFRIFLRSWGCEGAIR